MDLDGVADELYGLPPAEFTASRNAHIAQARRSGDRQLAAAIGELRRPTASAGIVNSLTRQRPDLIDELLALGVDMRQAQAALAGADLRRLSERRTTLLTALVGAARRLPAQQQHPMAPQLETEVSATLQAALADPEAAQAVRSGRLTAALHYSGFGLEAAVDATPEQGGGSHRARGQLRLAPPPPGEDEVNQAKLAAAAQTLDVARERLAELEQVLARADAATADVQRRRQAEADRITSLEQQLVQARADEREAAAVVRARDKDRDKAARAAQSARDRVEQAQRALDPT